MRRHTSEIAVGDTHIRGAGAQLRASVVYRRCSPLVQPNGAARTHGEVAVAAARAELTGRISIGDATAASIEALLGAPDARGAADARGGTTLAYALASRPGYHYVFELDEAGVLVRADFRRHGAPPAAPSPPARRDDNLRFLRQLAAIGATMDEVRAWLGDPAADFGWWPVEDWVYPGGLVIELRHGIVEAGPRHAI